VADAVAVGGGGDCRLSARSSGEDGNDEEIRAWWW